MRGPFLWRPRLASGEWVPELVPLGDIGAIDIQWCEGGNHCGFEVLAHEDAKVMFSAIARLLVTGDRLSG
jgi:hypothetical protein